MTRKRRIDERVVAVQHVEHGTVMPDHILHESDRLLEHCLAQLVREAGETLAIDGVMLFEAAEVEPVARELERQAASPIVL